MHCVVVGVVVSEGAHAHAARTAALDLNGTGGPELAAAASSSQSPPQPPPLAVRKLHNCNVNK